MNAYNNINLLNSGVIITNSDGIIQACNPYALKLLNTDVVVGRPIKYYIEAIASMDGRLEYINKEVIYIFGKKSIDSKLEEIFIRLEIGIFAADLNGEILFQNNYFFKLFEPSNNNIFAIFKSNNINISSFGILCRAKKEIVYEINLIEDKKLSLRLVPLLNECNEIEMVYGIITKTHNTEALQNQLNKMQRELDKYQSAINQGNQDIGEKPILQFHSKSMQELYSILSNISNKNITILLLGQSGTGKSSLAKKIHNESIRRSKPFVTINCSSLPENLIESELFGYEKGAFTGALTSGKKGLIEIADGGTLFIDEIGELPFHLQGKLLELVQEKIYRPVGSTNYKTANIRIIAATNKDLYSLVTKKKFREDLYYRIAVAVINIPPLSEHPEDIRLLLEAYTLHFNKKYDINVQFSRESKEILLNYNWPGNIREIEHIIEFLMIRSNKNIVEKTDLPLDIINYYENTICKNNVNSCPNSINIPLNDKNQIQITKEQINHQLTLELNSKNKKLNLKELLESYESIIINECYQKHKSSYKLAKYLDISQTKANTLIQKYCR